MPPRGKTQKKGKAGGSDARHFDTVEALLAHMNAESNGNMYDEETGWYGKSRVYWADVPATVNGVLTGKTGVQSDMLGWHEADIAETRAFIDAIPHMGRGRSIDCGAGVGRVTRDALCHMYASCDVMESQPHMLEQAREEIADLPSAGEFMLESMEKSQLDPYTYDLVLMQLAAMYLTDPDLVAFLKQAKKSLTKRGFIFLKENCAKGEHYDIDPEDNGLLRTEAQFKRIFDEAGLTLIKEGAQCKWPRDYATLKMFALR